MPNTSFGILSALAGSFLLHGQPPTSLQILQRLPLVVLFNWANVFIFELANQRSPESIKEDSVNKPWRPIPSGSVTAEQARKTLLAAVPIVMTINYVLGVWEAGVPIHILTWLYNDLRGGDEIVRDLIIAAAYGLFNLGSLQIAMRDEALIRDEGYVWIAIVSGVILTTMQVQDLKDKAGDKLRGRKTMPLVVGDAASRWMIASFMPFWSVVCAAFWHAEPWMYAVLMTPAAYVEYCALFMRDATHDSRTWKLWCFWLATLYILPIVCRK